MNKALESLLRQYPRPYITDVEFQSLFSGTANSRYSKVKRFIAQGKLLPIRRGLYCLTQELGYLTKPHPFELAQYIYGPSYISFESALSFHRLIPEIVYTITSATTKRAKEFETPLGLFSYLRLPHENFYTEVEINHENGYSFFMAKPWKAICDYVFCYKKNWNSLKPLTKSLRINLKELPELRLSEQELLQDYYHHSRISRFLKGVQKDFNERINLRD